MEKKNMIFLLEMLVLGCVLFSLSVAVSQAQSEKTVSGGSTIVFDFGPTTNPPYNMFDSNQSSENIVNPGGIMYDVLVSVASKKGYRVKAYSSSRKRQEKHLEEGRTDVLPNAVEWTEGMERFIATDPVTEIRDIIVSLKEKPVHFTKPDDLIGKTVGACLGYHYPVLDPYFDSKKILREDVTTDIQNFKKLSARRIDAIIVTELVGRWIVKTEKLDDKFIWETEHPINATAFHLIFNPKWKAFVSQFNEELKIMKQDGSLEKIIKKYSERKE